MCNRVVCTLALALALSGHVDAESFVAPFGGRLYMEVVRDDGGEWRFGLGTTSGNCRMTFSNVSSTPSGETLVGAFSTGETLHFCMYTRFGANSAWAFSNAIDLASLVAFTDRDNSLRMGGRVIEQTSPSTWLMHLDNAVSYLYDDDDNDIEIRVRLVPGQGISAGASFVVPFSGKLYLEAIGGDAASSGRANFGLGNSPANCQFYLSGLAPNRSPEILVGSFNAGVTVDFCMLSTYAGDSAWAFSNGTDPSSLAAFADLDNSLGMGGKITQQTSPNTWIMHLDYANLGYDDDDNDILMKIRLEAVPAGPPLLRTDTAALSFSFSIGGTAPASQTVSLLSTSTPVPFSITLSGAAWLSVYPLSGTTPAVLNVAVNPSGLMPGTHSGTMRIDAPTTNSPQTVSVTLTVRETSITWAPSALTFAHDAGAPGPPPQALSIASTGPPLSFTCSTSGGAWLAASPSQSTTPATLSVSVNAVGLPVGTYNGSIIIVASAASNAVQSIPVTLVVRPRTPNFAAAGIVNAASYAAGLVPGGLASIFGTGLSGVVGTEWAAGARSHKGVSVLIGGHPAPLIALINQSGQEQINVQAPFELQPGRTTTVEINNNGRQTAVGGVPVFPAQPGIFEIPLAAGTRVGAVIHGDGKLVTPANPARRGEVVSLFLTGAGPVEPAVATGEVGPVPPPTTVLPVVVGIANMGCPVHFAGYAPGALGLYQINFEVPSEVPSGPSLALNARVGESLTNTSSIAVQ